MDQQLLNPNSTSRCASSARCQHSQCRMLISCEDAIRSNYRTTEFRLLGRQGYCSYTYFVENVQPDVPSQEGDPFIVQFRKARHSLALDIARRARDVYGRFAPNVVALPHILVDGLQACRMSIIPGVSYSEVTPNHPNLSPLETERQINLMRSFATIVAKGWNPNSTSKCDGPVGSQIGPRLQLLAQDLPTPKLRQCAQEALDKVETLHELPIVLNHGDLVTSNFMVDPDTFLINGLVDWAESESLPFGTCLYGLENLLGFLSLPNQSAPKESSSGSSSLNRIPVFLYHNAASQLRHCFWSRLVLLLPELKDNPLMLEAVLLAKKVGTLLWFGFAWENGAVARVVNAEKDPVEAQCLELFLEDERDLFACSSFL